MNERMKNTEHFVRSPCIGVCELNEAQVCVGCFRTANEIGEWPFADLDARLQILDGCNRRKSLMDVQQGDSPSRPAGD